MAPGRCCPCMKKNGRCIRYQCVRKGLPCVDCWPSTTNPSRCENSAFRGDTATLTAQVDAASSPRRSVNSTNVCVDVPSTEVDLLASFLRQPKKVLKRIPCKSRITVARKLATLIEHVVSRNDIPSWSRLLQFPKKCLQIPPRGGKRWNLTSQVNKRVSQEHYCLISELSNLEPPRRRAKLRVRTPIEQLAARVSIKLEESDYRGAVRLACSEDVIAEHNSQTLEALREKHPPAHPNSTVVDMDYSPSLSFSIDTEVVQKAIRSFPNGSREARMVSSHNI